MPGITFQWRIEKGEKVIVEEWRKLDNLVENGERYKVSTRGRVYSNKTNRYLKPALSGSGYLFVALSQKSKIIQYDVHRLVAIAFLDNRSEVRNEINHIDGNKQNNNVNNLEWVSSSENKKHAYLIGLRKPVPSSNMRNAIKYNCKAVVKIRKETGEIVGVYQSANYLFTQSKDTPRRTISYQCQNQSHPRKGKYYYRFATQAQIDEAKKSNIYYGNEYKHLMEAE